MRDLRPADLAREPAAGPRPSRRGGTNQERERRRKLGSVLRLVHVGGSVSRSEIGETLQLDRASVAALVAELDELNLVEQDTPSRPRTGVGRPSSRVRVARRAPYVVAADVAEDRVVTARVALGGEMESRVELLGARCTSELVCEVTRSVRSMVAGASCDAPLIGIGVGLSSSLLLEDVDQRASASTQGAEPASFARNLVRALGTDVQVTMSSAWSLAALAEQQRGAGAGMDDIVLVLGGIGIKAGVIAGGTMLAGAGGCAGEVGHLCVDPGGRLCRCGGTGCWETYVGAEALAKALGAAPMSARVLVQRLSSVQEASDDLVRSACALGDGLAALTAIFDPQVVVLGGTLAPLYELLHDHVDEARGQRASVAARHQPLVATAALGAEAVLLGAAETAFAPAFVDPASSCGGAVLRLPVELVG